MSKQKILQQLIDDINADAGLDERAKSRRIQEVVNSDPLFQFLMRLPATGAEAERDIVEHAFGVPDTLKGKLEGIRTDADLTAEAKVRKVKEAAMGSPLGHLKQLNQKVVEMSTAVANLRKALAPPAPDRADLFGELQRREDRDLVRDIPEAERLRAVMEDERLTLAVLLGHPRRSGLSPAQLETVRSAYVERVHGPQLRGIEQREEIIATVTSALNTAVGMWRRDAGLTVAEVDAAFKAAA